MKDQAGFLQGGWSDLCQISEFSRCEFGFTIVLTGGKSDKKKNPADLLPTLDPTS